MPSPVVESSSTGGEMEPRKPTPGLFPNASPAPSATTLIERTATRVPASGPTSSPAATAVPSIDTESGPPDETPRATTEIPTAVPSSPTPVAGSTLPPATGSALPSVPDEPEGEGFPDAPDRDLYLLARSLILKTTELIPRVANESPVSYVEGRRDTFWLHDLRDLRIYQSEANLRLVSSHAYWYVEDGQDVSQADLEKSARIYEGEIYPRVTAAFGLEWTPGVDNDPHLTILHARIKGASGYFSSVDEYPVRVRRYSNQREMIYINTSSLEVGSRRYLSVLAHELQHAVHWNGDRTEETWVNEGLSDLAASVAGYRPTSRDSFLRSPSISLLNWPDHLLPYYGANFLFFDYLSSHYGPADNLSGLVREPLDGTAGIDAYLSSLGYELTFRDVFRDWVVANYLDEPGGGPYGHPYRNVEVRVTAHLGDFGQRGSSIPQYAAEYTAVDIDRGDIEIRFQGQQENTLLPVSVDEGGCWWSNRDDSISSTLTRPLDLTGVSTATLQYRVWFDIEEQWDYGYVEVSTDGGSTWDILQAPGTSSDDPLGVSFGPGYTGSSDDWLDEEVDLSKYAGEQIHLRFQYVTDEGINLIGLCIDDIAIPEIGFFDAIEGDAGWVARGFVRTVNRVRQNYIVQVIEVGNEARVTEIVLDEDNAGRLVVRGLEDLDALVVVVAALAPKTLQDAGYTLEIAPAT